MMDLESGENFALDMTLRMTLTYTLNEGNFSF